ncbi:histidine phosphatase family protein [Streptomyces sp. KPB2]|uniref:SixA phosphatase family protein n=1 Tax=unclassified Streptomyces TaxID=2593676 RepID=UPI000F6FE2DC|nr:MULTISPECIES: histidine phosphatase family protein [unclassified Streptomyces]WSU04450.1 histidine phosphatase family protein [Streptomyces sp. NBC_01124]AZM78475.1 histidine phosphatase family protein [Streptomyces sp. KPB2]MBH5133653.1 histidine phosphatase family protein [Streptomyces sp. HB-N217]MDU0253165.1 histidine phosphatase family protein [Streptomyces sp. PU10]QKW64080.1 histidine phosphatase family protein [Streptomyces sp. NA03103]
MSVAEPRRIVLFRHAKADWPQVSDHERPLADRGRMDAAEAGRRLADTGVTFDQALCSTAVRTRETWKLAVQEFPHRPKTVYEERIYEASPGELIAVLNETPDDLSNVLVIGHNPGMEALTEILAGSAEAEVRERINRRGFPTAAFAVLTFTGSWKDVEPGMATLVDYWAPTD